MFKLFRKTKETKLLNPMEGKLYEGHFTLPLAPLLELNEFYKDAVIVSDPKIKVQPEIRTQLVVIYNVRQLASEIAKCLKNGASDSGKDDDNGNDFPKK